MGETYKSDNIALLLDSFSSDASSLYESFRLEGNDCPVAVIDDDGFLPDDVISVYGFFLGDFKSKNNPGHPLYFNQIKVPEYWEISGNNVSGKVSSMGKEMARIFYSEPHHKRRVKIVDWIDDKGFVRISEHYNKYGALYGKTVFNKNGKKVFKTYFNADGVETIVENYVTGAIILEDKKQTRVFANKTEFVTFFIRSAGLEGKRLCFNSLSVPFFVSQALAPNGGEDILFWQEGVRPDIPGNMQMILDGQANRTNCVYVQKRKSYEKLISLGASQDTVKFLGFIYRFEKENKKSNNVLILTNSDRIENLRAIVEALPELTFHIGAITEMSSKLLDYEKYDNVKLYPGIKRSVCEELFKVCDWYFDINCEAEIVSAVKKAFLNNHIIMAFRETMHNEEFTAMENIFSKDEANVFIEAVKDTIRDDKKYAQRLDAQRKNGLMR